MKVSRTAAVLVGCAIAAASSDVVGAAKTEAGNNRHNNKAGNGRALRGGGANNGRATTTKAARTTHNRLQNNQKKRSLKSEKKGSGGGGDGVNRAFTTTTTTTTTGGNTATNKNKNKNAAANKNANQAAAGGNGNNTPYVNNKYDYLDRYSAYLTPEQLQRLRTNPGNPPSTSEQDETDVGGTEEQIITAPARPASTATTTTVTSTPYVPSLNRQDDGADEDFNSNEDLDLDLNRMSDATGTASAANDAALNRGFEQEAPVAGYNPETGYGTTGAGGDANANANASGGALDAARPIVQTTAWKPIQEDVWVEHYVPGVGVGANPSNANPSNTGGGSASAAFPNRNPSATANPNGNASNRIPATSGPCNGANPTAAPSLGIQHAFENVLWGSCTTTEGGCAPGDCCLYHPTFGGGACVPYDEICEPGETPGGPNGGCPYGWMTSDRCLCGALP